jgi:hypothetical protein
MTSGWTIALLSLAKLLDGFITKQFSRRRRKNFLERQILPLNLYVCFSIAAVRRRLKASGVAGALNNPILN